MAHDSSSGGVLAHWSTLIENFHTHTSPLQFYSLVEAAIAKRKVPDTKSERIDHSEGGILTARREYLRVVRGKHVFDICGAPYGEGFFVSSWLTETPPRFGWLYLFGLVALIAGMSAGGALVLFFAVGSVIDFSTAIVLSILAAPVLGLVVPIATFLIVGLVASRTDLGIGEAVSVIPFVGEMYQQIFQPTTYYKMDTALMFQKSIHNAVMEALDELTKVEGIRAIADSDRKPFLPAFVAR